MFARIGLVISFLILTGCFGQFGFMSQKEGRVAVTAIEISGQEVEDGVVSGNVAAGSSLTQVLRASSNSNIAAASVAFSPGTLAIDTVITLEEGANLSATKVLTDVGLNKEKLQAAAPAVVISSSEKTDAKRPFTLELPLSTNTGFFAATPDLSKIAVIFLVKKNADGETYAGILPKSQITLKEQSVLITTLFFGSYQVIYTADEIKQPVEAKTQESIVTKRDEIERSTVLDKLVSMFSIAVAHAAEMPTCDEAHLNQLVYIEETKEFKVCRAGSWAVVSSLSSNGSGGGTPTALTVTGAEIQDGAITDADISATAAIAPSKVSGLGSLATKSAVGSADITDGSVTGADIASGAITDASINAAANISPAKISGLGALATKNSVGAMDINDGSITLAKLSATMCPANKILMMNGSGTALTCSTLPGGGDLMASNNLSDLANIATARTNLGLGALAVKNTVTSPDVADGSIVDTDISASAAIMGTKINPNFGGQNITTSGMFMGDGAGLYNIPMGLTSCPGGFSMIGPAGKRGTFCIDTNQRSSLPFLNAKTSCHNLSLPEGRTSLCTQDEWFQACDGAGASPPVMGITGDAEWVDLLDSPTSALTTGQSSCTTMSSLSTSTPSAFRCCVR